eukprot:3017013-Pyramimonas_sp.AAC.1
MEDATVHRRYYALTVGTPSPTCCAQLHHPHATQTALNHYAHISSQTIRKCSPRPTSRHTLS